MQRADLDRKGRQAWLPSWTGRFDLSIQTKHLSHDGRGWKIVVEMAGAPCPSKQYDIAPFNVLEWA